MLSKLLGALALLLLCACTSESLGPKASLLLTTQPAFSASVYSAKSEAGISPEGPYSQTDVWLIIPPAAGPNAGVIVPTRSAVFLRTADGIFSSDGDHIRTGDKVEVWHDASVAYGAVQGPPGAPTYRGTQIVIDR
jgi:hypothetical protein